MKAAVEDVELYSEDGGIDAGLRLGRFNADELCFKEFM